MLASKFLNRQGDCDGGTKADSTLGPVSRSDTGILLILGAAVMVLAVACANVSSLQLARTRSRDDELRTRISLGATRVRIMRQLLTESALVGLLSGAFALLLSWAFLKFAIQADRERSARRIRFSGFRCQSRPEAFCSLLRCFTHRWHAVRRCSHARKLTVRALLARSRQYVRSGPSAAGFSGGCPSLPVPNASDRR